MRIKYFDTYEEKSNEDMATSLLGYIKRKLITMTMIEMSFRENRIDANIMENVS